MSDQKRKALDYHQYPKPGKISIKATKAFKTVDDLSLAYTPGVAEPVREIADNIDHAFRYTNKGNLVAVITDGSAVLGLGNVGALAGKPVMEGKAMLFKRFADIDVFDIEIDAPSTEAFIETVVNIAPTFGGINLEDIAAPKCFAVEQSVRERVDIPVFHDDQHGTAVVVCAGLLNALELQGKRAEDVHLVILGAGSAGLAIFRMLQLIGCKRHNIHVVDRQGVIQNERLDMSVYKQAVSRDTPLRTLEEALMDADVLIGVSGPDLVTAEMIKTMADRAILFALANPDPEIKPRLARAAKKNLLIATGRSDYPNQVNNALVFPFLFRGALDVHATKINDAMMMAVVHGLAELAKKPVPTEVLKAYALNSLEYGNDYFIPKQFDPRLKKYLVPRVAQAAIDSGVARINNKDNK